MPLNKIEVLKRLPQSDIIQEDQTVPSVIDHLSDMEGDDDVVHQSDESSQGSNFLGKLAMSNEIGIVNQISSDGNIFTAKLVRPKPTRDNSGYVYGFSSIKEEKSFTFDKVRNVLDEPERYGRGYFKFAVHTDDLAN